MTQENYDYRTGQMFLRNQFSGSGKLKIPIIPGFREKADDFDDLLMIGFDKISLEDQKYLNRIVHFFLYDYRFERVWKQPDFDIIRLSRYKAVLSPDFSMYIEMAPAVQLYNTFRNRWCGAYWASKGLRVIPTVNWGDGNTFDFCFDGIEKGSVVAVSTYMAGEHDNRQDQKDWFMAGYNEMLRRIEPEKIICYNTPFPEMNGNIVYVDYERSSWKYMSREQNKRNKSPDCINDYKIDGQDARIYCTIDAYKDICTRKGGGSAYGGKWKPNPNKASDARYLGKPGEIKTSYISGYRVDTKIGNDGRAVIERHYTDHNQPWAHSNPHDHEIKWDNPTYHPDPGSSINYEGDIPEFKNYRRTDIMKKNFVSSDTPEQNRFVSISDFKECMRWGGEVEFMWKGVLYGIVRYGTNNKISIYEANKQETEMICETADDALEYMIGPERTDRLRDVITQITILGRTI